MNRTQKVIIDGTESDTSNVLSGVPQGTVLGPILFLIYINDICSNLNPGTKLRLFADDSFLYREIKSNQDNKLLQEDLNTLQRWEMKWKMEFHPNKCQVLRITNKRKPIPASYTIHNKTLNETNQAKYLGVIIDSKLQWNYQNKYVCKKTNNALGFLRRNTSSLPKTVKENCYKTLVKPVIEYGCSVWDPHTKDQISNLDKIQKSAARYVLNDYTFEKGATNTNMNKLGWISLQEQRAKIKVTNFYKGLNKLIEIPIDKYCQLKSENVRTRQSGFQMFKISPSNVDSHLNSFFPGTTRLWNSLPSATKMLNTTEAFKNAIKRITLVKSP